MGTEKPKLLIVEDEGLLREALIRRYSSDYEVEGVWRGSEAIEKLRAVTYRAVLTDLGLPERDFDGVKVAREAVARQVEIVVLMSVSSGLFRLPDMPGVQRFDKGRLRDIDEVLIGRPYS